VMEAEKEKMPEDTETTEDVISENDVILCSDPGNDVFRFTVEKESQGQRLDVFLASVLSDQSRSFIQKLIRDGRTAVDGKSAKASLKLKSGQEVTVHLEKPQPPKIEAENIPLDILYEDDDILVVNKPKGMVVHPCNGHWSGTLVNAVMYHCRDSLSGINGVLRPGIVHRIDMNTTGSLVICKNDRAHQQIADQLAVHSITRRYRAIVCGNIREEEGTIDAPIGRSRTDRKKMAVDREHGKRAVTHYRVLERFGNYTYIECQLETGRTHQIRVHLAHIHHPVLGDDVYGSSRCPWKLQGQTLHAMVLGFIHPSTGQYVEFTAPLPEYFQKLLETLRKQKNSAAD